MSKTDKKYIKNYFPGNNFWINITKIYIHKI